MHSMTMPSILLASSSSSIRAAPFFPCCKMATCGCLSGYCWMRRGQLYLSERPSAVHWTSCRRSWILGTFSSHFPLIRIQNVRALLLLFSSCCFLCTGTGHIVIRSTWFVRYRMVRRVSAETQIGLLHFLQTIQFHFHAHQFILLGLATPDGC